MLSYISDIFANFGVKMFNHLFTKSIWLYFCNYEPILMKFSEIILLSVSLYGFDKS